MAFNFNFPLFNKKYKNWALYYVKEGYSITGDAIMGRHAAGWSYFKALIENRQDRLGVYIHGESDIADFKNDASTLLGNNEELLVNFIAYNEPFKAQEYGGIFVPGPGIAKFADERTIYGHNQYSIVGITHTTATHRVMTDLRNIITRDVAPWDALICTSKCVLDTVKRVFDTETDFLNERFGVKNKFIYPELPIIPLGIDVKEFDFSEEFKTKSRNSLNIGKDDLVVSFVGRLSFHAKAHHYPMYVALQNISKKIPNKKIHLIQTGWFGNDFIENAFKNEAKQLCPDVECHFLDGMNQDNKFITLSSSDIFMSLSDNIQETFGITPIEGMASGIPVIVSDWNGYRDTVRDNIDGYSITTISVDEGDGEDLAYNHMIGNLNYDHYVGLSAQRVAVDVGELDEKLTKLMTDENLRKEFGANGKSRAQDTYDWPIVLKQYTNLSDELDKLRVSSKTRNKNFLISDKLDPFYVFSSYPTLKVKNDLKLKKTDNIIHLNFENILKFESIRFTEKQTPDQKKILEIYNLFDTDKTIKFAEIKSESNYELEETKKIVIFLLKFGYLTVVEE